MTRLGPTDHRAAPFITRLLLALRVPAAEREFVKGDLDEGFAAERVAHGVWHARTWYARQLWSVGRAVWVPPPTFASPHPHGTTMTSLIFDIRHVFGGLRRAPLFSALVVFTLAIGIGATSAVFSVVYPVVLSEPPYPNAGRLVMLYEREPDGSKSNIGYLTGDDIRRNATSLASLAMVSRWQPIVRAGDDAQPLNGARVSHEYFATLGVRPALGHDFTEAEDHPTTRTVAMLSHALWLRQFGGDSSLVGGPITINGFTYTLAGVMPSDFRDVLNPGAEIWSPLGYDASLAYACRTCRHLRAVARLRDGVTPASAAQDIDAVARAVRTEHPNEYQSVGMVVPSLHDDVSGKMRAPILGIFAAVMLLVLLACANVANLFLGRTGERRHELAIRLALGAGRGRLVRYVALEAAVLSFAGGALGLLVAWRGTRALLDVMAVPTFISGGVRMSVPITLFALGVTALSAVIGATFPALLALGESALADIRVGTRALVGQAHHRLRSAVVIGEVGLALVLMAGAGVQVRSLQRALAVHTGFNAADVTTMQVALAGRQYATSGTARNFYRRLLDDGSALPGVKSIAVVSQLPLGGNFDSYAVHREDKPALNPETDPSAQRFAVSASYFDVMGIRLVRGRTFTSADREGSSPVVLFNRSGAARIFGTDDPIGKRVQIAGPDRPWRTVIGIVDDVRHLSLESDVEAQIYLPFDQNPFEEGGLALVVRTATAASVMPQLLKVAKSIDPGAAVSSISSMDGVVDRVAAPRRLAASLVGCFALIAGVLALGGLYGVMSASVAERIREVGLRAALGATPTSLVAMVVRRGLVLTAIGAALGAAAFLAAHRIIGQFVFGVSPGDPATLAGVAVLLGVTAVASCALPAARAARVDPLAALRD